MRPSDHAVARAVRLSMRLRCRSALAKGIREAARDFAVVRKHLERHRLRAYATRASPVLGPLLQGETLARLANEPELRPKRRKSSVTLRPSTILTGPGEAPRLRRVSLPSANGRLGPLQGRTGWRWA